MGDRRWTVAGMALALSVATGCASTTRIYVKSTDQTNDGNTLYMTVRSADGKAVGSEQYQQVAQKLFSDPPDPTIISNQPIFPGNTVSLTLDNPESRDIVIYFFFTQPGSNWRLPLRKPLPAEVFIDLGTNQIERVQIRKR
jgi:hypothetical protein